MRKQDKRILGIMAIILVFAVAVLSGVIGLPLQAVDQSIIYKPVIGTFECLRGTTQDRPVEVAKQPEPDCQLFVFCADVYTATIDCSQNVDAEGCKISLSMNGFDSLSGTETGNYIIYDAAGKEKSRGSLYFTGLRSGVVSYPATGVPRLYAGDRAVIYMNHEFNARIIFTPYALYYRRGLGGKKIWNARSCTVQKVDNSDFVNAVDFYGYCLDDTTGRWCDKIYPGTIEKNIPFNFVEGYVPVSHFAGLPVLDGQEVVCDAGGVYAVGQLQIKTEAGSIQTINVEGEQIATYGAGQELECCPGSMGSSDLVCSSNWKYVSREQPGTVKCVLDSDCRIGDQLTNKYCLDEYHVAYSSCVNGYCDYNQNVKKVDCCSSSVCPPEAPICDLNTNKCIGGLPGELRGHPESPQQHDKSNPLSDYIMLGAMGASILLVLTGGIRILRRVL